jgi:predicted ferric reductase
LTSLREADIERQRVTPIGLEPRLAAGRKPIRKASSGGKTHRGERTERTPETWNITRATWKAIAAKTLQGVLLAGGTAVVWLWLRDGGIVAVHNAAEDFTSAGRITGLLAGYLLAVQILLIIRVPFLEWVAGFDRLTRWHGLNGKVCLYLVLAHVGLITIGYAMAHNTSVVNEVSVLLTVYYGLVAAVIGTVLLILVVATSIAIVRSRLHYEWWYLVHLLTYGGLALVWFHEIRTGFDFITNPWAAVWWTGLYLITLQLLLLFRIIHPLLRGYIHRLRVTEVVQEAPGVTSVYMAGRHLEWLNPQAGQFFLWRFLTSGRIWEAHPFSLSAAPNGQAFRITAKSVGDFTRSMADIKPGTNVIAEGPFGSVTAIVRTRHRVALIAGGIGITPLRSMLEEMLSSEVGNVVLLYRVISESDIVFRDEIEELAERSGLTIHYIVGDHRVAKNRWMMSAEHLRKLVPDIAAREIYLCGPPAMVAAIEGNVRATGVPRKFIHIERFALHK